MNHHFVAIALVADLPPGIGAHVLPFGAVRLSAQLDRAQQLDLIAQALDVLDFDSAPTPLMPAVLPGMIPAQRFAPVESLYRGRAVQS